LHCEGVGVGVTVTVVVFDGAGVPKATARIVKRKRNLRRIEGACILA